MFVVIIVAFILIKRKIPISPRVNTKVVVVGFYGSGFNRWSKGNDGASFYIHRHFVERSIRRDGLAAGKVLPSPEINPILTGRKIECPCSRTRVGYRIYQQRRAEHKLVPNPARFGIRSEFKGERPHPRFTVLCDSPRA